MISNLIANKRAVQRIWALPFSSKIKLQIIAEFLTRWIHQKNSDFPKRFILAGKEIFFCEKASRDFLFQEIFLNQSYNIKINKVSPCIIDCGSNIGLSVIFFKLMYPNSRIIAFEPQDAAFECLVKTVQTNQITGIQCHKAALTRDNGELQFYIDDENPASLIASTCSKRMAKKEITVHGVRLSEYITEPVDLIKLDVEGGEMDVLLDLGESGKLAQVHQMIIEYHHHIEPTRDELSKFLAVLEAAGFGYQVEGKVGRPYPKFKFQDLVIYAYNKKTIDEG